MNEMEAFDLGDLHIVPTSVVWHINCRANQTVSIEGFVTARKDTLEDELARFEETGVIGDNDDNAE